MIVFLICSIMAYVLCFQFNATWLLFIFPLCTLGAATMWEIWKSKVRSLEREIEKLKKRNDTE